MNRIALHIVRDEAYKWLCPRRKDYLHNGYVWSPRRHRVRYRASNQGRLRQGAYRFWPVRLIWEVHRGFDFMGCHFLPRLPGG